jgi:hypothetical protein
MTAFSASSLQPCPNPMCRGDARPSRPVGARRWSIVCLRCGRSGPEALGEEEAARLWNLLPTPASPVLRAICAGCGAVLREGDAPEPVSHGMCPGCLRAMYGEEMAAEVAAAVAAGPTEGPQP